MIKVVKNILNKTDQEKIKDLMLESVQFPWYYIKDVTGVRGQYAKQKRPALSHCFVDHRGVNSSFFKDILPITTYFKREQIKILKAVSYLQFPSNKKSYDTPHVDSKDTHTVVLYYVVSSDGETVFFNKDKKIIKKVTPKQGTAVIFDGSILHTAFQPQKSLRCIVNINIDKSFEENY